MRLVKHIVPSSVAVFNGSTTLPSVSSIAKQYRAALDKHYAVDASVIRQQVAAFAAGRRDGK